MKFEKLYTIVAKPTAASGSVPSLPTIAVSTTPIMGSRSVENKAGIAKLNISASHGEVSRATDQLTLADDDDDDDG